MAVVVVALPDVLIRNIVQLKDIPTGLISFNANMTVTTSPGGSNPVSTYR